MKIANDNRSSHHSHFSSSTLSPPDQFFLPLEKIATAIENDDLSTNYDSDDGWSNDSAELIYVDERYRTQKKKNEHSSLQQQNQLLR